MGPSSQNTLDRQYFSTKQRSLFNNCGTAVGCPVCGCGNFGSPMQNKQTMQWPGLEWKALTDRTRPTQGHGGGSCTPPPESRIVLFLGKEGLWGLITRVLLSYLSILRSGVAYLHAPSPPLWAQPARSMGSVCWTAGIPGILQTGSTGSPVAGAKGEGSPRAKAKSTRHAMDLQEGAGLAAIHSRAAGWPAGRPVGRFTRIGRSTGAV